MLENIVLELAKNSDIEGILDLQELYLVSNRKLLPALALYRKVGFVEVPITAHDLALFERCDIRMNIEF